MRVSRSIVGLLAVLAVVAGGTTRFASTFAAPPPSAPIQTAVQPAPAPAPAPAEEARAPAALPTDAEAASLAKLRTDLQQIVARANTGALVAVLVASIPRGDTLYALNADLPLAPASNMKLYSTAAALYYLGPEFRYSTYVLGTGELANGVLSGDLILYGTGDPSLSGRMLAGPVAPLRALADTLLALGVREVRGDLVGDGSFFDAEWLGRGWSPDNFGAWYSAPVGALSIAENVVSIRVQPGTAAGMPARLTTTPATQGLAVINQVTTVASGQTVVRFEHTPQGLVLQGRIARNHPGIARSTPIVDPSNFTAAVFRQVLEQQGIRVHGRVRTIYGAADSPAHFAPGSARTDGVHPRVLAVHLSPTLAELISVTNHVSHNLFAEALLKTVGRVALGEGTFETGARAIRYFLECETEADTTALGIVDGSGLSPLNRVSARSTIQLLDLMTRTEHWQAFYTSLPQSGHRRPQGLQRMLGTPAERNLRAKTGTIRTVSSLSGYVNSADGELLAFSILGNNLPASTWAQKRIEDQIGVRLAEFSRTAPTLPQPAAARVPTPRAAAPAPAARRPEPRAAPAAAPRAGRTHRVRAGDTLDGIARRYGTTVRAIERANPGINPRRIQPGQSIRIPE